MKKYLFVVAVLILASVTLVFASYQPEEVVNEFTGKWTVRWLSNDTRNPIALTQTEGRFSGTYINDSKDHCSISGKFTEDIRQITLRVECPKWVIEMEGYPSLDGKLIVGKYLAYKGAIGGFIMTKD